MGAHSRKPTQPPQRDAAHVVTWLKVSLVTVAALAVLGTVALWPRGSAPDIGMPPRTYVDATILDARADMCPAIESGRPEQLNECTIYTAQLSSGPDEGAEVDLTVPVTMTEVPDLSPGHEIVMRDSPASPPEYRYSFEDFQRTTPLVWLAVLFVIAVVAFGRWQGLRALAGLSLSLLVLTLFIVPALLRDSPALIVALVGSALVAYLAIYLAHGFGISSSIALAGTLVSLALTAALAMFVASLTQLSGLGTEEAQVLRVTVDALDLRGLLVAGIVIGALGVLDDVTVSQVATVAALRRANPSLTGRQLYAEAIRVGRDHVAAAVNTLVLAYAGASLPLLLFFAQGEQPIARLLTGELMAVEIVRMLVGSVGLILSVPITTGLAAVILSQTHPLEPGSSGHTHSHGHGLPADPTPVPDPQQPRPGSGDPPEVKPWF